MKKPTKPSDDIFTDRRKQQITYGQPCRRRSFNDSQHWWLKSNYVTQHMIAGQSNITQDTPPPVSTSTTLYQQG